MIIDTAETLKIIIASAKEARAAGIRRFRFGGIEVELMPNRPEDVPRDDDGAPPPIQIPEPSDPLEDVRTFRMMPQYGHKPSQG